MGCEMFQTWYFCVLYAHIHYSLSVESLYTYTVGYTPLPSLQDLMNLSVERPHFPYIRTHPDTHLQAYVELLVRAGVATRHADDEALLRLVPFHLRRVGAFGRLKDELYVDNICYVTYDLPLSCDTGVVATRHADNQVSFAWCPSIYDG